MREINLANYQIRTDLITDIISKRNISGISEEIKAFGKIKVSNVIVNNEGEKIINKKAGLYTTIFFDDVTDSNNRKEVSKIFLNELKKIIKKEEIKASDSILIIGLGNSKSTPDSLGPKVVEKVKITRHIYNYVGSLEKGYMITSGLIPGVMGNTGIETKDIILGVINKISPNLVIVIDALASDDIEKVNKTIQMTNTGIHPGSGVENNRGELSKYTLGVPVIAIGVPTVVDATTIVSSTINFMLKHFSYNIKHQNESKFIPPQLRNYLVEKNLVLSLEEREKFLGLIGTLTDVELKTLLCEVLTPIGYNLMVTPKEIDFVIDRITEVIVYGIDNSLHQIM